MSKLKELRERAGFTVNKLAGEADVSASTINRMERGDAVNRLTAYKVLNVLSDKLGKRFEIDEVEGLQIHPPRQKTRRKGEQ